MIDTSRITSDYDFELQLGSGWFMTAITELHERNLLIKPENIPNWLPDDLIISVDKVEIRSEKEYDIYLLLITNYDFEVEVHISLSISEDGSNLILTPKLLIKQGEEDSIYIPLNSIADDLAEPIKLIKLKGDELHENVICIVGNMDLRTSDQRFEPLEEPSFLPRGNINDVQSFLPIGKHIAIGISTNSLDRIANDIWHKQLTDEDGKHPFPDKENKMGHWKSVTIKESKYGPHNLSRLLVKLEAIAYVDTPLIDIIKDPEITINIYLTPIINDGKLTFETEVTSDVEFGVFGSLIAAAIGGFIGIGLIGGVIILKVGESIIADTVVTKKVKGLISMKSHQFYAPKDEVLHFATILGNGFNLGFLDSLPSSIPIHNDNPDLIHMRTIFVTNSYDTIIIDDNGLAIGGGTTITERYTPENAKLCDLIREGENIAELIYKNKDGVESSFPIEEILERAKNDEVQEPLKAQEVKDVLKSLNLGLADEDIEVLMYKKDGKIPIVCLYPEAIKRENSIITNIRFSTGLELKTKETVFLQNSGVVILPNLQLIHTKNGGSYYRAKADNTTENNFESLPTF
jgi:hypothetical protein